MFEIDTQWTRSAGGDNRRLVDHERGAHLELVGRPAEGWGAYYLLVWQDVVVPVRTEHVHTQDPATGQYRLTVRIASFGRRAELDARPYRWTSSQQQWRVRQIAVEALVVFGHYYDGLQRPEGAVTVEDVDLYGTPVHATLASFGYPGAGAEDVVA